MGRRLAPYVFTFNQSLFYPELGSYLTDTPVVEPSASGRALEVSPVHRGLVPMSRSVASDNAFMSNLSECVFAVGKHKKSVESSLLSIPPIQGSSNCLIQLNRQRQSHADMNITVSARSGVSVGGCT